jgi:hypothetical protein
MTRRNRKDAINRRLYKGLILVETAIYRVSCLNQTVSKLPLPLSKAESEITHTKPKLPVATASLECRSEGKF